MLHLSLLQGFPCLLLLNLLRVFIRCFVTSNPLFAHCSRTVVRSYLIKLWNIPSSLKWSDSFCILVAKAWDLTTPCYRYKKPNLNLGAGNITLTSLHLASTILTLTFSEYPQQKEREARRTVYVDNLNPFLTAEHILNYFQFCGDIRYLRIGGDWMDKKRYDLNQCTCNFVIWIQYARPSRILSIIELILL